MFITKDVLSLFIFTAFFISLAKCDCTTTCVDKFTSVKEPKTEAQICPIIKNFITCVEQSCKVDLSPLYTSLNKVMKTYNISCDFFISLTHIDCTTTCVDKYTSVKEPKTEAQICPVMKNFITCLEQSCKVDLSPFYTSLNKGMKTYGSSCDLNGASRSLSFSLLTVCGSVLLTSYRIFSM